MKSTDAVDPLLEILNQRYIGWYSHLGAAQALGGIGDPQALPALIRIATGSWHLSASLAAVEALGQVGGQTAVDALKELLNSESISIRAAAIKALGKEGGRSAVGALEGLLSSKEFDVRNLASFALEALKDEAHDLDHSRE